MSESIYQQIVRDLRKSLIDCDKTTRSADRAAEAREVSDREAGFSDTHFFTDWFRTKGHSYYFLFKKNLRVTNVQFAELLALLRTFVCWSDGSSLPDAQFVSVADFHDSIKRIVDTFRASPREVRADVVSQHYASLLSRALVLDPLFGSCIVYTPPGVMLPLEQICGYSGYVHSCGFCAYVRNVYKAEPEKFYQRIVEYLTKEPCTEGQRILFRIYSHEDFDKNDRDFKDQLRFG